MAGLLLCLCFNTLFAANPSYVGVVKDDSGNPLEFVNVTLITLNDSTLIDGTITDMTVNLPFAVTELRRFCELRLWGSRIKPLAILSPI